uniref:Si:dkeyp-27e10.3 n=1 Tax=Scleropages formosus TaxID=113540 RepID=A0A8C9RGU7_SCLFO
MEALVSVTAGSRVSPRSAQGQGCWALFLILGPVLLVSMATASSLQTEGPRSPLDRSEMFAEAPRRRDSSPALLPLHTEASDLPAPSRRSARTPLDALGKHDSMAADTTPGGTWQTDPGLIASAPLSFPVSPDGHPASSPLSHSWVEGARLPEGHSHVSRKPVFDETAQGIHQLLNPPEMLVPSFVPFIRPQSTLARAELTLVPTEDVLPTSVVEDDWGSGDYLETMSFLGPEEDDFAMVTSLPTDISELEDFSTEDYDTSFPSRVVPSLSSLHMFSTSSFIMVHSTSVMTVELTSVRPSHSHPAADSPVTPQNGLADEGLEIDWAEVFTIEPTEILLPDMNSLEYYTTLLAKENASSTEHRENLTSTKQFPQELVTATRITPTGSFSLDLTHMFTTSHGPELLPPDNSSWAEEASTDISGSDPVNSTMVDSRGTVSPSLVDASERLPEPSDELTPSMVLSTSLWGGPATPVVQADIVPTSFSSTLSVSIKPTAASISPSVSRDTIPPTAGLTPPTTTHLTTTHLTPTPLTEHAHNVSTPSMEMATTSEAATGVSLTSEAPTPTDRGATVVSRTTRPTPVPSSEIGTISNTVVISVNGSVVSATPRSSLTTTLRTPQSTTSRQYICNITKPDMYLVRVGLPTGSTIGYTKSQVREILKVEFNRSVELQVVKGPPDFIFRVVSGPVVYTAVAVVNALRLSTHTSSNILSVSPVYTMPDAHFQVHSVLQFVPGHVDVRICTFSERVERGLSTAYAEVRRRSLESANFSIDIVNITASSTKGLRNQKTPVDITFAVRDASGYLRGSDVSNHLRLLSMVEFSFYLGFPVLQIAEPFHYPELNVTHLMRSSWVRSVLLGVLDQRVNERTFQAQMERRLAQLLGEVLGTAKRWKRATSVGNNSIQIVRATRLEGLDDPLEVVYFVEGPGGERFPANKTANLLNRLDMQRAAIILGYRVQAPLAQPVEKLPSPPSETQNNNMWIIVGVVVPVLVVVIIIVILYWKLCRSDKLEFQPDAMSTIQQRQKLQAPSVKGFDFAKLHLGQHSKDDIMVIQEPAPLPAPVKETTPSENGEAPTPKSKASSTKASRTARRRGRISPSDGDSVVSEPSSPRESTEETLRTPATPNEGKQPRRTHKNGKSKIGTPQAKGLDEPLSSASIFEHVDRMSRSADGTRRVSNKIQLIAMQPMPVPAQRSPSVTEKVPESVKANAEIQVALRHKSEIEHHRNKIRLRAKRRGHYEFPAMDDIMDTFGDPKDQDMYQKAQMQIDKILEPDAQMLPALMEPRKRGRRSPKQRKKQQVNGSLKEADKDRLIPADSDGTYRKYPGVNNVAYVSDPDQPLEAQSPSPTDDVFVGSGSPPSGHAPAPPAYVPPQPSIEEARQQMHSLLDDAFALVSPSSQGSVPGITLPGLSPGLPRIGQWAPPYPGTPALSPFSARYAEGVMSPSGQGISQRPGLASDYTPPDETGHGECVQEDALYSSRDLYGEELPSSARPRPVGGTTGAQLHQLTQVGLSSRIGAYPGVGRVSSGQTGGSSWGRYHSDEDYNRPISSRDQVLGYSDCSASSALQMPRTSLREPSAPPAHLDGPGLGYSSTAPEETSPPTHSSASLIKAIREELMRLSQKQSAVPSYHS